MTRLWLYSIAIISCCVLVSSQTDDIDACTVRNGGCEHECINANGTTTCECRPGYELLDNQISCQDIDECETMTDACGINSFCRNTFNGFECVCDRGFVYDEMDPTLRTCRDLDECSECSSGACSDLCVNTEGSFVCFCLDGYEQTNHPRICKDVDECALGRDSCDPDFGICINAPGSFACTCQAGLFRLRLTNECILAQQVVQIAFDLPFDVNLNDDSDPATQAFVNAMQQTINDYLLANPAIASQINSVSIVGDFLPGSTIVQMVLNSNSTLTPAQTQLVLYQAQLALAQQTVNVNGAEVPVVGNLRLLDAATGSTVPVTNDPCFLYEAASFCQNGATCIGSALEPAFCLCPVGFEGPACEFVITTTTSTTTPASRSQASSTSRTSDIDNFGIETNETNEESDSTFVASTQPTAYEDDDNSFGTILVATLIPIGVVVIGIIGFVTYMVSKNGHGKNDGLDAALHKQHARHSSDRYRMNDERQWHPFANNYYGER